MSLDDTNLDEVQRSLTLIDVSLRRIAYALEAIARKTDERFRTPAEVQREQARQHIVERSKSKHGELHESGA
jgi:hypothetical protein